jgi:hypothetical protein
MDRLNPPATDDLSSVLRAVNLRSVVYCISELGAPWGFRVEKSVVAKFHLVLAGAAVLSVEGDDVEPVTLDAGHLVLLPHGSRHDIRDQPNSRVRGLERIVVDHPIDEHMHMTYGGSGPHTSLLCGGFDLHGSLPEELGDLLPRVLVLDSRSNGLNRWLEPTLQLLQEEHAGYLSTTSDSLNCIAQRVGYSSESALSKAFKREYGRSPRDYRRDQLAVPIMQT